MIKPIELLKEHVIEKTNDHNFIHHKWYYNHHLKIVEQLTKELCTIYTEAKPDIVQTMVRLHDYDKICNISREKRDEVYKNLLENYKFEENLIVDIIQYIDLMERKSEIDISQTPIEVQIISSADGASHFIGPFMFIHRWENQTKGVEQLQEDNINKANKDRARKITLPEIKKLIEPKYKLLLESMGEIPEKLIN